MKISKRQLRKIILESLLVEAVSVEQAEAKLEKEKMKIWKSLIFVVKRDGIEAIRSAAQKYNYEPSPYTNQWDESPLKTTHLDGASYGIEHLTADELFRNIDNFIPVDVDDADRSNSILWLIKQFKSDLGLFFAVTEEEEVIENNYGNLGEVTLVNKIRNSLEKFGQFKHLLNPPEKRDLFRIANMQELFSIVEAHEEAIDAENTRIGARVSAENVIAGFIPLRGGLNIVGENIIQKNPQTGFYTKPDSEGIVIGEIHSKPTSIRLGSGTDWCTAAPGLNYFNDYYAPEDPLIYIEVRGTRWQFSYGSNQFMDKHDDPIGREKEIELSRLVWQAMTNIYGNQAFDKFPDVASWVLKNLPDVEIDKDQIMKMINKGDPTVLAALAKHPETPTEGLMKIASNMLVGNTILARDNIPTEVLARFIDRNSENKKISEAYAKLIIKKFIKNAPLSFYLLTNESVSKYLNEADLSDRIVEHVIASQSLPHIFKILRNNSLNPKYIRFLYEGSDIKNKIILLSFRKAISENLNTPEDILADAVEDPRLHKGIAGNKKTTANMLLHIAKNSPVKNTEEVAMKIVNNPNLTKEIYNLYVDRAIAKEVTYKVLVPASRFVRNKSDVIDLDIIEKIYQHTPERGQRLKNRWEQPAIGQQPIQERWVKIAGLLN